MREQFWLCPQGYYGLAGDNEDLFPGCPSKRLPVSQGLWFGPIPVPEQSLWPGTGEALVGSGTGHPLLTPGRW